MKKGKYMNKYLEFIIAYFFFVCAPLGIKYYKGAQTLTRIVQGLIPVSIGLWVPLTLTIYGFASLIRRRRISDAKPSLSVHETQRISRVAEGEQRCTVESLAKRSASLAPLVHRRKKTRVLRDLRSLRLKATLSLSLSSKHDRDLAQDTFLSVFHKLLSTEGTSTRT